MPRRTRARATPSDGIAATLRAASTAFDTSVDSWFDGLRRRRGSQKAMFAASLLAETALFIAGGAAALRAPPSHAAPVPLAYGTAAFPSLSAPAPPPCLGRRDDGGHHGGHLDRSVDANTAADDHRDAKQRRKRGCTAEHGVGTAPFSEILFRELIP